MRDRPARTGCSESQMLADHRWIRELARTLVHDTSEVEDVAQDAWVAAARSGALPADGAHAGEWLRRVVRNLASNRKRDARRRRERESMSAHRESRPSTVTVIERAEAQQRVLEAVLALRQPYRETVLLRFWDDLPPRRIARALDVPVETVRTRIKRATHELRDALDRDFGDRTAWCAALLPLCADGTRRLAPVGFLGALGMTTSR